jgi:hypothetical protein
MFFFRPVLLHIKIKLFLLYYTEITLHRQGQIISVKYLFLNGHVDTKWASHLHCGVIGSKRYTLQNQLNAFHPLASASQCGSPPGRTTIEKRNSPVTFSRLFRLIVRHIIS